MPTAGHGTGRLVRKAAPEAEGREAEPSWGSRAMKGSNRSRQAVVRRERRARAAGLRAFGEAAKTSDTESAVTARRSQALS